MIIVYEKWALTIFLIISIISRSGKSQIPIPMPGMFGMPPPPPIYGMPGMAPMAVFDMQAPQEGKPKPNNNNNGNGNDVSAYSISMPMPMPIPMPMPLPVQMPMPMPMPAPSAIPAMTPPRFCQNKSRQQGCPPCPPCLCSPSCTPAFFSYCSPCHKKCRCRSKEETPSPRPPVQGPAFAVAFPPPSPPVVFPMDEYYNRKKEREIHILETDECVNSASNSCEEPIKRSWRRKHRNFRRFDRIDRDFDSEFVRPEISYIGSDGEVKITRRLSNAEAENLLGEGKTESVTETTKYIFSTAATTPTPEQKENSKIKLESAPSKLLIVQEPINDGDNILQRREFTPESLLNSIRKRLMRTELMPEIFKPGKKQLVFKPPQDKKISNISVSFMVT